MANTTETVAAGRLGHTIKRAEQALIARKTEALREFGLTVPQYSVLLLLSVSDGMSAAQLARECMVTPQTMATRAGRAIAKKADKAALRVEGSLSAEFTPEELAHFEEYLERAIALLGSLN
jgi:DNA-binding MarR family transcriptional regulator